MRIFISLLLTLSLMACNQKKNLSSNNSVNTNTDINEAKMNYENTCFEGRSVTKEVTEQEAEMVMIMNQYMFTFENTRWQPCAVPAEFQKEGMKVKVSGQVLEIKANERRAGTPFYITSLMKM